MPASTTLPADARASAVERWVAPHAPHVEGAFHPPDEDDGSRLVELSCAACGGRDRRTCRTGNVRHLVMCFAASHLHRDPLGPLPRAAP